MGKPIFYYDGECGFCVFWSRYWEKLTGDNVVYKPFTQHDKTSSELHEGARVYFGAEGVARLLAHSPDKRWFLWLYVHIPLFSNVSEFVYQRISKCRSCGATFTKWIYGKHFQPPSYYFTRSVFLTLLGVVYLFAFVSFAMQIPGLIGDNGILPAQDFFTALKNNGLNFFDAPSLAWLDASTQTLQALAWIGAVLSVFVILQIQIAPLFLFLWLFELSLVYAGQQFMSFQWDIMLLEVGFLAIFFAPTRFFSKTPPSTIVVWLYRFLIARLMFFSGYVKLASGDQTWRELAGLDFHYFTQPIPNPISWFAHQLPMWFDHIGVFIMFAIQLVLPFFIFLPRRFRFVAGFGFIFLEALIGITGNYAFFTILTIATALLLFDDGFFHKTKKPFIAQTESKMSKVATRSLAVVIVSLFLFQIPTTFRLVNQYGLFARMTTARNEIEIQGSLDGEEWKTYEFKYKPGQLDRRPPQVAPFHPRLDWQMWFAALSSYEQNPWFGAFAKKLLNGSNDVTRLLETNPFEETSPIYIRALLFEYEFTNADERAQTGNWWKREGRGLYMPQINN